MSTIFARCSQGHVFERGAHDACPHCGEQIATSAPVIDVGGGGKTGPGTNDLFDLVRKHSRALAAALTVAVVVALAGTFWGSSLPVACCGSSGSPDDVQSVDRAVTPKPEPREPKISDAGEETLEGVSFAPKADPEPVTVAPPTDQKQAGLQSKPGTPNGVPDPTQNDGPNYAVFATETSNALSPLARELLATSRGYFAFTRKEYSEARAWLTTKAARSNPAAMYWLGLMTERGNGGEQSHERAFELIMASAKAGYPPAQTRIAEIYLRGEYPGMDKDRAQARYWLVQVAKEGFPETAKLVEEAGLTPKDIGATMLDFQKLLNNSESEAFKIAADLYHQNVGSARYWAGILALAGKGSGMSNAEAEALIQDAARLYTTYAIDKLARRAASGSGRDANPVEAAALGHLARINAPSEGEIELIDSTLKPTTRSLTDKQYMDLRVLLSGIVELPHRW